MQSAPFDVGVSEAVTQNIALTLGAVSEAVEIMAGAELIQQASSDLGTVIPEGGPGPAAQRQKLLHSF